MINRRSFTRTERFPLLLSLALALGGAACDRDNAPAPDPLLRIKDDVFDLNEMQKLVDSMPEPARQLYVTDEQRRGFIKKVVQTQILAEEAKRLHYDQDPEIVMMTNRAMALKLMKERLGAGPPPSAVSDVAIQKYFSEHGLEFSRAGESHITEVIVDSAETAQKVQRLASEVEQKNAGNKGTTVAADSATRDFRALVFEYSKDVDAKQDGGDRLLIDGQPSNHPPEVVAASFALQREGEVSPVVQSQQGFHIIRLRKRVPASQKTLAESRDLISKRLSELARDQSVDGFVAALSKSLKAEIFEQNFAKVRFDANPQGQAQRLSEFNRQQRGPQTHP